MVSYRNFSIDFNIPLLDNGRINLVAKSAVPDLRMSYIAYWLALGPIIRVIFGENRIFKKYLEINLHKLK
jgi:hypothetical protein